VRMQKSLGVRIGGVKSLLSSRQPAILAGCTHFRSPRHHTLNVRAAAASSGSEDPYKVACCCSRTTKMSCYSTDCLELPHNVCDHSCVQVLSLPKNADSQAILRAYRNKLRDNKGNDDAIERIEAAHTAILMRGLSSRLSVMLLPLLLCDWRICKVHWPTRHVAHAPGRSAGGC